MSVLLRYVRYLSIGMSASEIDQLIRVLEQVLSGCEIVTTGVEGTRKFVNYWLSMMLKVKYSPPILVVLTPAVE